MKKIAAMVLAGVLAAVPVSTTGAAEFQDGADTQNFIYILYFTYFSAKCLP